MVGKINFDPIFWPLKMSMVGRNMTGRVDEGE